MMNNPEFEDRFVASIGLDSKDPDQAEVIREPKGYTPLKNRMFVAVNRRVFHRCAGDP
jgi:hypothetical protein